MPIADQQRLFDFFDADGLGGQGFTDEVAAAVVIQAPLGIQAADEESVRVFPKGRLRVVRLRASNTMTTQVQRTS
jgi:hypothetical protein